MKTLAKALVIGAALWATQAAAATLIVDNRSNAPTGTHIFSTLQAAHDAATAGDIIHITPSPLAYASTAAEISKPLTIYGIGYDPDNDFPTIKSTVSQIHLNTGAEGTVIEGLVFINILHFDSNVSNIAIRKCLFVSSGSITEDNVNKGDITISDCVFNRAANLAIDLNTGIVGPVVIRNNLFIYSYCQLAGALVINNVFAAATNTNIGTIQSTSSTTFQNNIYYRMNPLRWGNGNNVSVSGNIFEFNMIFEPSEGSIPNDDVVDSNTGTGNIENTDPLFINFPAGGSNTWFSTYDFDLQTNPASPAIDAGKDGTDIGITGGSSPYDPVVGLPTIQRINTAGSVKKGTDLSVSIDAQAN